MRRTVSPLVLFVVGIAATLLLAMYSTFATVSDDARAFVLALGTAGIVALCAAVVLGVALSFGPREPWRRQWLLVGLGVAAYAMGELVRAADIATNRALAWLPSADIFVVAQYVLLGAAFVAVAESYETVTDPRRPAIIVLVFGALALLVLWFGLIVPFVLPYSAGPAEALRTALFPTGDVLLLLAPAAYVAMALGQLGGARFARPWFLVAAGAAVLALSDAALVWLMATGAYLPGTLVDYGVIGAELLIAAGALAAARMAEEFMPPAVAVNPETPAER